MSLISILKSILQRLGAIADYVVEEGESGIWTYRKWASGVAECWGVFTTASSATQNTEGASYFTGWKGTYPSNLFIARPVLNGDCRFNWIGGFNQALSSNTATTWYGYLWSFVSRAPHANIDINLYAIGKWK